MKRAWWIAISCLLAWISLLSQVTIAQQPQDGLVSLTIEAADQAGSAVLDLQLIDFKVLEDRVAQQIKALTKGDRDGEYILSYYPAQNPNTGKFRHIEVRVLLPNLRLTTKPGYASGKK